MSQPTDRHRREGNLQSDLEALLRQIGVGSLESHYSTARGEADIFLPNRRTFFELKAYPLAANPNTPQQGRTSETPRQQLDRYVTSEIKRELDRIPSSDAEYNNGQWYGILTDGRHWHTYTYLHQHGSVGQDHSNKVFAKEYESLANYLETLLSDNDRRFGREWIPSDPGNLFTDLKDELTTLNRELPMNARQATQTKKALWLEMMRTSGMVPTEETSQQSLFITHSFLTATVRLVSHSLFPANSQADWKIAISDGFAGWVLESERGKNWCEQLHSLVSKYDWRRREEDVLRSLYERNVADHDRKVFGEFYTPDWLAELMVDELLDDDWLQDSIGAAARAANAQEPLKNIGVLDPACGSGTFLYHAARRILSADSIRDFQAVQKADIVCRLINGMDIHPIAVELAQVNLERILPAPPSLGKEAFQIHLGDSLQTDLKGQASLLFGNRRNQMRIQTPQNNEFFLPMSFVRKRSFANDLRIMVKTAESNEPLPDYLIDSMTDDEAIQIIECHQALCSIIESEGNSVWTWYTINIVAPHLLAERKVNRIVANPPWVKLADIQVEERKRTMEDYGDSLNLRQPGRQAPHTDIASYFILAARSLYLSDPDRDPACWLVKKSAIASGQWQKFRDEHQGTLAQSVDLERLQPFGVGDATRSCLLMEHRCLNSVDSSGISKLEARTSIENDRPKPTEPLESARRKFHFAPAPEPLPQAPSDYLETGIRQGATLVPHVLSLVAEIDEYTDPDQVSVTTRGSSKHPWNRVMVQQGIVPKKWIYPILTSPQMPAFIPPLLKTRGIIPVDDNGLLLEEPGRDCPFWRVLDEHYETHRSLGRNTPQTLIDRFNYGSGLFNQLMVDDEVWPWTVLYPSSGDIMRGSRVETGTGVADSTLFWFAVNSKEEAGYVVALLNSASLESAFRQSRESGRHFQLHPWRKVPIPRYDEHNSKHRRLGELCLDAEEIAHRAATENPDMGQVGLSRAIRGSLRSSPVGQEIEQIVCEMMPDQASEI